MSEQPNEEPPKPEEGKPSEEADKQKSGDAGGGPPSDEKKEEKKEERSGDKKKGRRGKVDLGAAKIGLIGAGKVADAIVRGLMQYAKVDPKRIHVSAKTTKNLEAFKQKGCHITKRNYDIFAKYDCDVVFLCFHGNVIKQCYKAGGSDPTPSQRTSFPI